MESKITRQLSSANVIDRDHLAVSYADEPGLAHEVSEFVNRGLRRNQLTIMLITRDESDRYAAFLGAAGMDVDRLRASGDLAIELIDDLLQGDKDASTLTAWVSTKVSTLRDAARSSGKSGLNILGNIAGNLVVQGRYRECLELEAFWHDELIQRSEMPITLLCPYEVIPAELQASLQEPHTAVTRIFSGANKDIEQLLTAAVQRAASDPVEPIVETVQDRLGPNSFVLMLESAKQMRVAHPEFRVRLVTSVTRENLATVKDIASTEGFEVRHIDGIKARFATTRTEYIGATRTDEVGQQDEILWSNSTGVVSQTRSMFELLWQSAIPASLKINELESGRSVGEVKLTFDGREIFSFADRALDEAREEVLIIVPREGGIKDNIEFFSKVGTRARQGVKAKILGRFSLEDAALLEGLERDGVEIRKLGSSEGMSLGIYDRRAMGLVQQLFPSSSGGSDVPYLSGIISTSSQMVSGVATLFDDLWQESELRQRAELMKDILTHDIRNYNMIARANAELLRSDVSDAHQIEFIKSIVRAMDSSTELIQRTRTLGELTSQPRKELRSVVLNESFERAFSVVKNATAPDRPISFSIPVRFADAKVVADELLDQVFVNVLTNAVKYTDGTNIQIQVVLEETSDPNQAGLKACGSTNSSSRPFFKITVIDNARGMTDAMKETAAMRYRGAAKGRGLGLSIVRALVVERYGGRLQFRDRVDGDHTRGTRVEMWLPKA